MNTLVFGNIFGLFSSITGLAYFKSNNKNRICLYSIIMCIFQIISMIILNAYSGMVVVICNIFRAILTRFNKWNKYFVSIFICIILGFTIYFYDSPLDFLCVIGASLNNIGFLLMQKNNIKAFRWLRFIGNLMWIGYYLYIVNIASMCFELVYMVINLREIFKKI